MVLRRYDDDVDIKFGAGKIAVLRSTSYRGTGIVDTDVNVNATREASRRAAYGQRQAAT
jgi:hypothetical protein